MRARSAGGRARRRPSAAAPGAPAAHRPARSRARVARNASATTLRSPPARSSRSRRRAGRPARPPPRRDAASCSCARGQRREIGFAAGATGCPDRAAACRAPSRARRRARSRTARRTAAARSRSACTSATFAAPVAATVRRSSCDAPVAHIAGDDQAALAHGRGKRRRLAAGRRAGVEHARPGAGPASSATSCDASSCTTNQPASESRLPQRVALRRRRARPARSGPGRRRTPRAASRLDAARRGGMRRRLARSVSGAGALLNCIHASAAVEPEAVEPARGQPARDARA